MELIERVKEECEKHENDYLGCLLHTDDGCLCAYDMPKDWDIEAIRKALGEEQKEEIVVPEKWSKGFAEIVAKKPKEAVLLLFEQQNEIIDCLEQIKERVK